MSLAKTPISEQKLFYNVGIIKMLLFSIATAGFYDLYWMFKQWKAIKAREKSGVSPLARTVLYIFYIYPLFKKIYGSLDLKKELISSSGAGPGFWALLYIIGSLLTQAAPDPYWQILAVAGLPILIPIQNIVHRSNRKLVGKNYVINKEYSWLQIVLIVFGIFIFTAVMIASFLPEYKV